MFLTRMGFDSKVVITGDITQVDLPGHKMSGLIEVQGILKEIPGLGDRLLRRARCGPSRTCPKDHLCVFPLQRGTRTPPPGERGERQRQTARLMIPETRGGSGRGQQSPAPVEDQHASAGRSRGTDTRIRWRSSGQLSIVLVNDAVIAKLNAKYHGGRGPTDILSFDYGDGQGELILSVPRAVIQARTVSHDTGAGTDPVPRSWHPPSSWVRRPHGGETASHARDGATGDGLAAEARRVQWPDPAANGEVMVQAWDAVRFFLVSSEALDTLPRRRLGIPRGSVAIRHNS